MIQEFLNSWELFHWTYIEGWLIAFLLAVIGVAVVARDQIFIGAAVSQASTVGIALTLYVASLVPVHEHVGPTGVVGDVAVDQVNDWWLHSDAFQSIMAVVFSVVASILTNRASRARAESYEAITGWVFLVSASLTVLLLAHSPLGESQIQRLHSSTIIGATPIDAGVFAAFCALTISTLAVAHRRFLLFVTDPSMAAAVGMRVGWWSGGSAIWLGLAIGLSIQSSGMLYTFGTLVLPALIAKNLCHEVQPMFLVSPSIAIVVASVGFVLANHYDFPPAQMTIALLALLLGGVWLTRGSVQFARYLISAVSNRTIPGSRSHVRRW
jgi:ABC-type Mn2+/Zn2+ transport system permease subunit